MWKTLYNTFMDIKVAVLPMKLQFTLQDLPAVFTCKI